MGTFPKQQNKNNRTKPPANDTTKMLFQRSRHTIGSGVVWGATRHTVGSKFRRFLRMESFVGSEVCCKWQGFGRKMDRGERFVAKRLLPMIHCRHRLLEPGPTRKFWVLWIGISLQEQSRFQAAWCEVHKNFTKMSR